MKYLSTVRITTNRFYESVINSVYFKIRKHKSGTYRIQLLSHNFQEILKLIRKVRLSKARELLKYLSVRVSESGKQYIRLPGLIENLDQACRLAAEWHIEMLMKLVFFVDIQHTNIKVKKMTMNTGKLFQQSNHLHHLRIEKYKGTVP